MEAKIKIKKTLHADNNKTFRVDDDIYFELTETGDKYIGRIKKIKKKSIIIDNIEINGNLAGIAPMKIKLEDIKPYSCQYLSVD